MKKNRGWVVALAGIGAAFLVSQGCSTTGGSKTATPAASATSASGATWTPLAQDTITNTISPTATRTVTRTRTNTPTFTQSYTFTPVFTPVAYLATIGGINSSYVPISTVYVAPVPPWGGIGNWSSGGALPQTRYDPAAVATGGYLYEVGGYDPSYNPSSTVYSGAITGGTVGAFSAQTSIPAGLSAVAVATDGSYLYIAGGYDASYLYVSTVYSASASGGTVGSWTSQPALAVTIAYTKMVYDQGYLYIVAGDAYYSYSSSIYRATASAGVVGSWSTTTNLPVAMAAHQAFTDGINIFSLGGATSPSTVYTAPISSPGTLGSWTTTSAIPGGRMYGGGETTGGFAYIFGGYDQYYTNVTTTYFSPITSGTLGTWVMGAPLSQGPAETASANW